VRSASKFIALRIYALEISSRLIITSLDEAWSTCQRKCNIHSSRSLLSGDWIKLSCYYKSGCFSEKFATVPESLCTLEKH